MLLRRWPARGNLCWHFAHPQRRRWAPQVHGQETDAGAEVEQGGADAGDVNEPRTADAGEAAAPAEKPVDTELAELLDTPVPVWLATKAASDIEDAPAIVTVVTRQQIEEYNTARSPRCCSTFPASTSSTTTFFPTSGWAASRVASGPRAA